ncbi:YeeE/YedE family protein [Rudaea cellulosilytica]|uniref:YeeE/YedE family protein n=1 Tax=Rudaea cellulosilytica TaxID=540746 RepID=UPI0003A55F25|nr:YeeE/YedE thiosulfate transporter family protein [Rudaea cellulosilytica]
MNHFYIPALGGTLIGLAAILLMATLGRIAGISGIAGRLVEGCARGDRAWRVAFILGLILAPLLVQAIGGNSGIGTPDSSSLQLALAGLCVGIGTRISGGCTSGHGVCGVARLSVRSIVATLVFMACGIATVFAIRHLGWGG